MKARYCPECGEDCSTDATSCPACEFPLALELEIQENGLLIPPTQAVNWQRIQRLLARGGMRINTVAGKDKHTPQLAWLLPVFGFAVLFGTLIFGESWAESLWGPLPSAQSSMVDLSAPPGTSPTSADGADPDFSGSSLMDALRTTDEQRKLSQQETSQQTDYREKISVEALSDLAAQSLYQLEVGTDKSRAILVGEGGYFLVQSAHMKNAFRMEKQTVRGENGFYDKWEAIKPTVGSFGAEGTSAIQIESSEQLGLSLVQAPQPVDVVYKDGFFTEPGAGEEVYIGIYQRGSFQAVAARIVDRPNDGQGLPLYTLDTSLGPNHENSPVFNAYGQFLGVFLRENGRDSLLAAVTIRIKSPLLYKHIYRAK